MKNTALNFLRRANGFAWRLTSATVKSVLVRWGRRTLPFATRCVWLHPRPGVPPLMLLDRIKVSAPLTAIAAGDHPTLELVRQALEDAAQPPRATLRGLEQRLREVLRSHQGTLERNAYLTGLRAKPIPIAEDAERLSLPPAFCRFLYYLVRAMHPALVVELGTAHGVSASHMLTAMEESGHGHLHTIDGDPARRRLAVHNLQAVLSSKRVTSHVGMFAHVLPPLLASVDGPVDLAFDDGDHQPASTLANFQLLFPRLRSGGVLVIDDINHLTGVAEVWQAIVQESGLAASVEINGRVGVCIKR